MHTSNESTPNNEESLPRAAQVGTPLEDYQHTGPMNIEAQVLGPPIVEERAEPVDMEATNLPILGETSATEPVALAEQVLTGGAPIIHYTSPPKICAEAWGCLICGLLSLFMFYNRVSTRMLWFGILGPIAIALGCCAHRKTRKEPLLYSGDRMVAIGIVLASATTVFGMFFLFVFFFVEF